MLICHPACLFFLSSAFKTNDIRSGKRDDYLYLGLPWAQASVLSLKIGLQSPHYVIPLPKQHQRRQYSFLWRLPDFSLSVQMVGVGCRLFNPEVLQ